MTQKTTNHFHTYLSLVEIKKHSNDKSETWFCLIIILPYIALKKFYEGTNFMVRVSLWLDNFNRWSTISTYIEKEREEKITCWTVHYHNMTKTPCFIENYILIHNFQIWSTKTHSYFHLWIEYVRGIFSICWVSLIHISIRKIF